MDVGIYADNTLNFYNNILSYNNITYGFYLGRNNATRVNNIKVFNNLDGALAI